MKILNYSKLLILVSVLIIVSGIYIISSYGFKTSIEYTGGTVFSYNSSKQEDLNSIKNFLKSVGYETSEVSQEGNFVKIKVSETNCSNSSSFLSFILLS